MPRDDHTGLEKSLSNAAAGEAGARDHFSSSEPMERGSIPSTAQSSASSHDGRVSRGSRQDTKFTSSAGSDDEKVHPRQGRESTASHTTQSTVGAHSLQGRRQNTKFGASSSTATTDGEEPATTTTPTRSVVVGVQHSQGGRQNTKYNNISSVQKKGEDHSSLTTTKESKQPASTKATDSNEKGSSTAVAQSTTTFRISRQIALDDDEDNKDHSSDEESECSEDRPGAHRISHNATSNNADDDDDGEDFSTTQASADEENPMFLEDGTMTTTTITAELAPDVDKQIEAALEEEREKAAAKIVQADVMEEEVKTCGVPRRLFCRLFLVVVLLTAGIVTAVILLVSSPSIEPTPAVEATPSPTPEPSLSPSRSPTALPSAAPTSTGFYFILQRLSPVWNNSGVVDPSSDAYTSIEWLANSTTMNSTSSTSDDNDDMLLQRFVLALLYLSCGGPGWRRQTHWMSQESICDWEDIECSDNNEESIVVQILLVDNNLQGTLPTEIGLLTNLHIFQANDNPGIVGTIPTEIGGMTSLHFCCSEVIRSVVVLLFLQRLGIWLRLHSSEPFSCIRVEYPVPFQPK